MKKLILLILLLKSTNIFSQSYSLAGIVLDDKGTPIPYATTALLEPSDSTLAFYAVTNSDGSFEIKNIKAGAYLLQASFLGYKTYYSQAKFPQEGISGVKTIVMEQAPVVLNAANVNAERIPLSINGDTIEYNASSYKTQPDAVTEDLLKKLPGVEVDRNGNIRAQGEDVKKVTVDGKEFFGNDPKIATKNLPADAINKVQVFDTKSDQAELTGINDGKRDKTINLQLKDDHKSAWFGEVSGGYGTDDHYQANAKAYRFNPTKQIAFLGMLNNINKFGFSFSDYMDFNGGFRGGESFKINSGDNSFPINFGETQKGLVTSGAGGANFSSEPRKDNRFNLSYLANGVNKDLSEQRSTTNYTPTDPFYSNLDSYNDEKDRAHRINYGWKNRIDSMQTLNLSGQVSMTNNDESNLENLSNYDYTGDISSQSGKNTISGNGYSGNIHSSYLRKLTSDWKLLNVSADVEFKNSLSNNEINTLSKFYLPPVDLLINQFQENDSKGIKYWMNAGLTRMIGAHSYIAGSVEGGRQDESYTRTQGLVPDSDGKIDSLSGELNKYYEWVEPSLSYKRITEKTQLNFSLGAHFLNLNNSIVNGEDVSLNKLYLLPSVRWEDEYKRSHRLLFMYESYVEVPTAKQFFPLTDYFNPLNLYSGNQKLKPEIHHDARMHWSLFDQFSFTSVFAALRFSYVKDKISWEKSIGDNLVQYTKLINVPDDYQAGFSTEFSTPIRKLGINATFSIDEIWSKTLTYVDGSKSNNSSLMHGLGFSVDNRKKNKWDVSAGVNAKYDRTLYSINDGSKQSYVKGVFFSDINYNPSDKWHFLVKADLTHYFGNAFGENERVPLLQAEASYLFLKHKRGTLKLTGFDLLNRNSGIERMSQYNTLTETHSDIIKRYFMLTFTYKLNRFSSGNNVDVKVSH